MSDYYRLQEVPGEYAGEHPVAAATEIKAGGLVALDASGNAVPAASTVTGHVIGRAEAGADNSAGSAGDVKVLVKRGRFICAQDGDNPVTKAHVGKVVFATAPDTIANTGTCRAGVLLGLDSAGNPILDTTRSSPAPASVTLGNANSEISGLTIGATYSQSEVQALQTKCEELADDVRALYAALQTTGTLA